MNINRILKNILLSLGITVGFLYILFLVLPFIISPMLNGYVPKINEEVKKTTGFVTKIEGIRLLTTPKLTIGAKVAKFVLLTPENKEILNSDNFEIKMSLLQLLTKKIRIDVIRFNNLDLTFGLNKDGSFEIEKYFPEENKNDLDNEPISGRQELPFGLKLSNHLPDIRINGFNIKFMDLSNDNAYIIKGNKTEITDFILNKNIKILSDGNIVLKDRVQFKYNIKIYNKIMPDIDFNELVFNPHNEDKKKNNQEININILDIFQSLYNYKITANVNSDLVLTNDVYNGYLNIDNFSISPNGMVIPPSDAKLIFRGKQINIDSNLYTAQNESSKIAGSIKTGKNTNLDINFKSQADLSNIIRIVNAFAMTFNIKDLKTLSANGKINADFNIKSNMKAVNSKGFLKIPAAKIAYGLYNITIDNINADIALDDNNINIKHLGFSILNQPLKVFGLIKQDATADLHLTADNLSLKGLLVACGQAALLKDNKINSGLVSLKADIVGKLDSIKPTAKITLNNLDIKNVPSDIVFKLPLTNINILADGQSFSGTGVSSDVKLINPVITVSVPKISANIKEDIIEITQTPIKAENINLNAVGTIKNYLTEKIYLDFITTGDIKSKLSGEINPIKQTLNLNYATTHDSTIVVPMFNKSKMIFNGSLAITGSMLNPQVGGNVYVPAISIPEIPVTMENLAAKLHGDILNGNVTVAKFTSGGIYADAITSDFSMKGENFYLKNLNGNSFDGKFNGDIIYNMSNAKTAIDFKGEGMNADKAITGTTGIKNALSGTLGFDANLNLTVFPEYNDMLRSVNGKLNFEIKNGAFGKIGRLENFLQAGNIIGNAIFKTTVASLSNIAAIKNSAQFDYISGAMTLSKGWANISNIKSTGKSIAYYVTGKYNIINGTANVNILGRLDGTIVKLLGPIGELSAEKILSYIPKLGELTARYAESMTTDPDKEKTKEIPALSTSNEIYKDFKVVFNGGIESTSSVKSFKWLSKADTSAIEQQSIKETVKSFKTNVNNDINTTVTSVKDTVKAVKEQQEQLKESVNELKNLFKF